VRQPGERAQGAAAEVEHVHTDLGRGVGEREAEDHRGQAARLARPRPADDCEVPGRARKVDDKRIAPLQVGTVDQAHGHLQRDPLRGQLVQRRWRGERRQPDPVRGRALARQRRDDRLQDGGPLIGGTARRGRRRLLRHPPDDERVRPRRRGSARDGGRGRRAGDVRAPEPHQLVVARGQERRTRGGGQLVRVRHAEHGPRLGGGERAQCDAVRQVRLEPAQPALVEAL
jgi:hypothetical protein